MKGESGNVSIVMLLGMVGVFAATTNWNNLNQKSQEISKRRLNIDGDNQSLTSLTIYKSLLSSNGANSFGLYPEPYLSATPRLEKHQNNLSSRYDFKASDATTRIQLPIPRSMNENELKRVMTNNLSFDSICGQGTCGENSIRLLRYNRDLNGARPERIVSVDVEINTPVHDERTNITLDRSFVAQVPLEAPKTTFAILRLREIGANGQVLQQHEVSDKAPVNNVKITNQALTAELVVGGVALSGRITLLEGNIAQRTVTSDQQWGIDKAGYPRHPARSIRNQSASLVNFSGINVANARPYQLVASVVPIDQADANIELRFNLTVSLPPPPDPWICQKNCADQTKWYYGNFINAPGAYWSMIPGKFSCMWNSTGNWSKKAAHPIYSFDPAQSCKKEGPVGHRSSQTGCFTGETLIRMEDGSERSISSLQAGDRVWNPIKKQAYNLRSVTVGNEQAALISIHLPGGKVIQSTYDHPFIDAHGKLVAASQLKSIFDENGTEFEILITKNPNREGTTVWNIELEAADEVNEHFILANGFVAGDLFLQKRLGERDSFTLMVEEASKQFANLDFYPLEPEMR